MNLAEKFGRKPGGGDDRHSAAALIYRWRLTMHSAPLLLIRPEIRRCMTKISRGWSTLVASRLKKCVLCIFDCSDPRPFFFRFETSPFEHKRAASHNPAHNVRRAPRCLGRVLLTGGSESGEWSRTWRDVESHRSAWSAAGRSWCQHLQRKQHNARGASRLRFAASKKAVLIVWSCCMQNATLLHTAVCNDKRDWQVDIQGAQ